MLNFCLVRHDVAVPGCVRELICGNRQLYFAVAHGRQHGSEGRGGHNATANVCRVGGGQGGCCIGQAQVRQGEVRGRLTDRNRGRIGTTARSS